MARSHATFSLASSPTLNEKSHIRFMRILITGAADSIGSNLARLAMTAGHGVEVFDKLTYAGMRENTTTRQALRQGVSV